MTATSGAQRLDGAFSDLFETEVRALLGDHRHRRQLPRAGGTMPALPRHPLPPRRAHRGRRSGRARILHRRRQADPARRRGREDHARTPWPRRATRIRDDVHQVQPAALSITNATEYGLVYRAAEVAALGELAKQRGLALHMDGARLRQRAGDAPAAESRRRHLARRRRRDVASASSRTAA